MTALHSPWFSWVRVGRVPLMMKKTCVLQAGCSASQLCLTSCFSWSWEEKNPAFPRSASAPAPAELMCCEGVSPLLIPAAGSSRGCFPQQLEGDDVQGQECEGRQPGQRRDSVGSQRPGQVGSSTGLKEPHGGTELTWPRRFCFSPHLHHPPQAK